MTAKQARSPGLLRGILAQGRAPPARSACAAVCPPVAPALDPPRCLEFKASRHPGPARASTDAEPARWGGEASAGADPPQRPRSSGSWPLSPTSRHVPVPSQESTRGAGVRPPCFTEECEPSRAPWAKPAAPVTRELGDLGDLGHMLRPLLPDFLQTWSTVVPPSWTCFDRRDSAGHVVSAGAHTAARGDARAGILGRSHVGTEREAPEAQRHVPHRSCVWAKGSGPHGPGSVTGSCPFPAGWLVCIATRHLPHDRPFK